MCNPEARPYPTISIQNPIGYFPRLILVQSRWAYVCVRVCVCECVCVSTELTCCHSSNCAEGPAAVNSSVSALATPGGGL